MLICSDKKLSGASSTASRNKRRELSAAKLDRSFCQLDPRAFPGQTLPNPSPRPHALTRGFLTPTRHALAFILSSVFLAGECENIRHAVLDASTAYQKMMCASRRRRRLRTQGHTDRN